MDQAQTIFLAVSGVVILWEIIKGWRLGIARQILRLVALVTGYTVAILFGKATVPFLRPLGMADFVLECLGGALIGTLTYLIVSVLGGIILKKTSQQKVGAVWFFYGVTGALLGVAFGLVFVVMAAIAARFLGTLADGGTPKPTPIVASSYPGGHQLPRPVITSRVPPFDPAIKGLIQLKNSLETGMTGEVLTTVDPIPKTVYVITEKIGQLASRPEALNRFLSFPGAKELSQRPDILALKDDPEIVNAISNRHYLALLKNERIVKVMNDPVNIQLLKKFDFQKALDYALNPPPVPIQATP